MAQFAQDPDAEVATLGNGVRALTVRMRGRETAHVSVFVRSGSQHETRRTSGIGHVVEHMAFKGTRTRDCQRINLDAERLGAEVNAHTDKDHTAFHMVGRLRDVPAFIAMLADIVQHSTFPEAELERERQVILHELTEDEEDPVSTAFKAFDKACWGEHALARPVIGSRSNIERFTREDLLSCVQHRYSGCNIVVGVAADIDPARVQREVQAAFAGLPRGSDNGVAAPRYLGGTRLCRLGGSAQTHVVLGYPIPGARQDPCVEIVAAALFGDGMSSPLLDQIRERRGLAYHAACSADVLELAGQFVIEASTAPQQVEAFFTEVMRLLAGHARGIDKVALERARNQLAVRSLRARERAAQRLETAALDLFVHGTVRNPAQWLERVEAVTAAQVRQAFARLTAAPPALAMAGRISRATGERVPQIVRGARVR